MKLSAKAIITFNSVNSFVYGSEWSIRAGEPNTLYFQIVDLDQDELRYLMGIGVGNTPASINVTFPSIDDDAIVTVAAIAVDAADSSLWKVILADDEIPASGNVMFALTEGSVTRRFQSLSMISVEHPDNDGSC